MSADRPFDLGVNEELVELAAAQPVASLPVDPSNSVEERAIIAVGWIERSWFAGEPLIELLFLFFALEALLGDESEGLKAHGLAFRQAMLSGVVQGAFSDPNRTYLLYDQVRSTAVHGGRAPEVDEPLVKAFRGHVRRTLNEYLTYARRENISRGGALVRSLDNQAKRPELIEWLRARGGGVWNSWLDAADGP
jgi:hypothetical protein